MQQNKKNKIEAMGQGVNRKGIRERSEEKGKKN